MMKDKVDCEMRVSVQTVAGLINRDRFCLKYPVIRKLLIATFFYGK